MHRLRRFVPGLVGLGLAVAVLWRGGAALERVAEGKAGEHFAVHVEEVAPVLGEETWWRARVSPPGELERLEVSLDGEPVERSGNLELSLAAVENAPGWHFVEVGLERRGGRRERVVDPVLVGRFADITGRDAEGNRRCSVSLAASPELVEGLVVPLLERELLPPLRANEHMGPDTVLDHATLELGDDVLRFEIELRGVNTLAVSGVVALWIDNQRELAAKLVVLREVDFRGKLRTTARGVGAGGGALVGGLVAGPLAPVGALGGAWLADKYVSKKAREIVHEQVEDGLEKISGIQVLPPAVELVPGRASSTVELGFCDSQVVTARGISASFWIEPEPEPGPEAVRFPLGVEGSLDTGARLTREPLAPGEDLRLELSLDLVNALLTEWTQSGLLAELIGEERALERANAELEAWTPLRLAGLRPTRPPVLTPIGGTEAGWSFGLGGLHIELEGGEELPFDEVYVAAAGTLEPRWDANSGSLSLAGGLDRLDLTCARQNGEVGDASRSLRGCFSEVLEAVDLRARIDEQLRPGAGKLPSIALRELLAERVDAQLLALELARPRPNVLRLSAQIMPPRAP